MPNTTDDSVLQNPTSIDSPDRHGMTGVALHQNSHTMWLTQDKRVVYVTDVVWAARDNEWAVVYIEIQKCVPDSDEWAATPDSVSACAPHTYFFGVDANGDLRHTKFKD